MVETSGITNRVNRKSFYYKKNKNKIDSESKIKFNVLPEHNPFVLEYSDYSVFNYDYILPDLIETESYVLAEQLINIAKIMLLPEKAVYIYNAKTTDVKIPEINIETNPLSEGSFNLKIVSLASPDILNSDLFSLENKIDFESLEYCFSIKTNDKTIEFIIIDTNEQNLSNNIDFLSFVVNEINEQSEFIKTDLIKTEKDVYLKFEIIKENTSLIIKDVVGDFIDKLFPSKSEKELIFGHAEIILNNKSFKFVKNEFELKDYNIRVKLNEILHNPIEINIINDYELIFNVLDGYLAKFIQFYSIIIKKRTRHSRYIISKIRKVIKSNSFFKDKIDFELFNRNLNIKYDSQALKKLIETDFDFLKDMFSGLNGVFRLFTPILQEYINVPIDIYTLDTVVGNSLDLNFSNFSYQLFNPFILKKNMVRL